MLGFAAVIRCSGDASADPLGVEGAAGEVAGLGLLDVETVLTGEKTLRECEGVSVGGRVPFRGYEMHVGRTSGPDAARPLLRFADGRVEGAVSARGEVRGRYVHGLFSDDGQRAAWLERIGALLRPSLIPRRSNACSTGSPRTWRRMPSSTRCSRSRAEPAEGSAPAYRSVISAMPIRAASAPSSRR